MHARHGALNERRVAEVFRAQRYAGVVACHRGDHARDAIPYDEEFLLAALLHDIGNAIDPQEHVAAGLDAIDQ